MKTQIKNLNWKSIRGFTQILSSLEKRGLTDEQVHAIESHLDGLDLTANTDNRKKYLKGKLNEFSTYLRNEFSLITEGYYTSIGLAYGLVFGPGIGLTFGTAFGAIGISIGLSIGAGLGMTLGMMYGAMKDAEVKKQGRVLA